MGAHPAGCGPLAQLDVHTHERQVPAGGDVIMRPCLVDAGTMRPVPVRVVQRVDWHHSGEASFVIVVRSDG